MKQNLRSVYFLILCTVLSLFGNAQDEVTNTSRTSTSVAGAGTKSWDAPTPALVWQSVQKQDDGQVASITLAAGQTSDFLVLSNFAFNVPLPWTINQIIVNVYGNSSVANSVTVPYVQLVNTSGATYVPVAGSAAKSGSVRFETNPISSLQTYGSSCSQNCYWNTNLTPSAVNNATFGLAIQFTNTSASSSLFNVDFISVKLVLQPNNIALPVNFISFAGKKMGNGTQLNWKVGEEKSGKYYEVERSTDGVQFTSIGNVRATGDKAYTYTDAQATTGSVFYRLKNVDMNDKYSYSNILSFKMGKAALVLKAFPMPVQDNLVIQHALTTSGAKINISDLSGRLVKSIIPAIGSMQTSVDFKNAKAGMYLMSFDSGDGELETLKLIKQ